MNLEPMGTYTCLYIYGMLNTTFRLMTLISSSKLCHLCFREANDVEFKRARDHVLLVMAMVYVKKCVCMRAQTSMHTFLYF